MIEAPYREADYDPFLEKLVDGVHRKIEEENDDYLFLVIGETGAGKSNLAEHMMERYMNGKPSIEQVALSREELAESQNHVSAMPKPRALMYDEANVNRRDSMTGWNKDLYDLYSSNRGLNIFHLWCNPSVQSVDLAFVEERVRGLFLVIKKGHRDWRYYYYFTDEKIDQILSKYKKLSLKILYRVRKKYSYYRGWFKIYKGVLQGAYERKKDSRMIKKVQNFYEKYRERKTLKRPELAEALGVHPDTISRHSHGLIEKVDYEITPVGRYLYTQQGFEKIKANMEAAAARQSQLMAKIGTEAAKKRWSKEVETDENT